MKYFHHKFIGFGILLCAVLGCSLANSIKKEVERSQSPQVIVSKDNICQLTVPGNWKQLSDLHEDAIIQAANLVGEQYVIVLRDDRKDFGKNFTLDSMTEISRNNFTEAAAETNLTEPVSVKINGYDAKKFEASGEIDNIKIKYLYGIIETPNNFYQVITWSLNSKFDANKNSFLEAINSFKETDAPASVPPPPPTRKIQPDTKK